MNLSRPVYLFRDRFLSARSAVPYLTLAFESPVFQLGNTIYLRGANRIGARHPGTVDAPEQLN
jgi:hypothetical protein